MQSKDDKDIPGYAIINGKAVAMTRRQLEAYLAACKVAARKRSGMGLTERYEGNAEVQRFRMQSKDENAANAVDLMTGSVKKFEDAKAGESTSEEKAREKAREIAKKSGIADA